MIWSEEGNIEIVRELIERGANINEKDKKRARKRKNKESADENSEDGANGKKVGFFSRLISSLLNSDEDDSNEDDVGTAKEGSDLSEDLAQIFAEETAVDIAKSGAEDNAKILDEMLDSEEGNNKEEKEEKEEKKKKKKKEKPKKPKKEKPKKEKPKKVKPVKVKKEKPRSEFLLFIISTKTSSVPAIFSAIATTASFPLATAIPLNKS